MRGRARSTAFIGAEFERAVKAQLEALGWQAKLTPRTGDFGADIVADCDGERLVVQCKCYSRRTPIPFSAVQEIFYAQQHFGGHIGAIIYSGRLSRQAQVAIEMRSILALNLADLVFGCRLDRSVEGKIFRQREACLEILSRRETWIINQNRRKVGQKRMGFVLLVGFLITLLIWQIGYIGWAIGCALITLVVANSFSPNLQPIGPSRENPLDDDVERAQLWLKEMSNN